MEIIFSALKKRENTLISIALISKRAVLFFKIFIL